MQNAGDPGRAAGVRRCDLDGMDEELLVVRPVKPGKSPHRRKCT
jgi:hypothetical protein